MKAIRGIAAGADLVALALLATGRGGEKSATGTPRVQQTVTATAEQGVEEAPLIPHTLRGRENCLLCHGPRGARPAPATHAGRANDGCQVCHRARP